MLKKSTINLIITIAVIIVLLLIAYYIMQNLGRAYANRENFTTQQTDLANKILTYLQQSPNNYAGYVNVLVANHNTSMNLVKQATYNAFVAKGKQLQLSDILAQF